MTGKNVFLKYDAWPCRLLTQQILHVCVNALIQNTLTDVEAIMLFEKKSKHTWDMGQHV